ncbi:MAG: SDR family oxidoreductase [Chloroflexota bacterium]|nr:SDR family oxidoreductase [Chloroflexota bacterium]
MAGQFDGKVALVTGAGGGIGRATALAFAQQGAKVVAADITVEGGEETVRQIKDSGGDATFVGTDVTKAAEVEAMVNKAVDSYGRLDFAHNNAGTEGALATTVDYPEDVWNRVLAINLTAVWLGMKYEIPRMLEQGGGAIVNTASILGLVGFPTTPAYTASKHGVVGLTKVAALENATQGIRVNAVCPGWIETPMVMERGVAAGANREVYDQIANMHPVKRLGKAEEIAQVVVWLCSDAASFVTGQPITVDGAYTAQ